MSKAGVSRPELMRAQRREAIRDQLSAQKHHEKAFELINKIQDLNNDLDNLEVQRLSKAFDGHLKLLSKYLPDAKDPTDLNLGGQKDNPLITKVERVLVQVNKD